MAASAIELLLRQRDHLGADPGRQGVEGLGDHPGLVEQDGALGEGGGQGRIGPGQRVGELVLGVGHRGVHRHCGGHPAGHRAVGVVGGDVVADRQRAEPERLELGAEHGQVAQQVGPLGDSQVRRVRGRRGSQQHPQPVTAGQQRMLREARRLTHHQER